MLYEYKDIFVAMYSCLLWPLIIIGFLVSRDANVRWFLLGFALITLFSIGSGKFIKHMEWPGWVFHLSKIGVAYLVMQFVLYRPILSMELGEKLQQLPLTNLKLFLGLFLPSNYSFRLVPAELAMRKLYLAIAVVQAVVVAWYFLTDAGVTSKGGLFEQYGVNRYVIWDAAYSAYLVFLILELLLLLTVVVSGFRGWFKA